MGEALRILFNQSFLLGPGIFINQMMVTYFLHVMLDMSFAEMISFLLPILSLPITFTFLEQNDCFK